MPQITRFISGSYFSNTELKVLGFRTIQSDYRQIKLAIIQSIFFIRSMGVMLHTQFCTLKHFR